MISNTLNTVTEKIKGDNSLVTNSLIQNVFENFQAKSGQMSEYDQMQFLKTQLTNVNSYVNNETLNEALKELNEGMDELVQKHPIILSSQKANGFGLREKVIALKESSAYNDPNIKVLVESFAAGAHINLPEFYHFNDVTRVLSSVNEHVEAAELNSELRKYIEDNKKSLLLLETIDQLKTVPKMYDDTIQTLNEMVATGNISSARLEMKLDEIGKRNEIVSSAIQMLKNWEGSPANQFNLGNGNHGVLVESYIGPALKNDDGLVIFADNAYYQITKNDINESNDEIRHVLGKSGEYTIVELNAHAVHGKDRKFYDLVESFKALDFKFNGKKIKSSLRQLPIEIALNESESLDLFIDGNKIENINEVKFPELFALETSNKKNDAIQVLKNNDKIFNIDFIKFIMNENKSSMVVNIENDYYVYDRLNESRVDVFKMNGYQLFQHLKSRFGYDTRNIFDVEINESMTKYNELATKKRRI